MKALNKIWILVFVVIALSDGPAHGSEFFTTIEADERSVTIEDPAALRPIGRTIVDRRTGETLELVCLFEFDKKNPCRRFQLRRNGRDLIGNQIVVREYPVEEFKAFIAQESNGYYKDRRWKYHFIPLAGWIGKGITGEDDMETKLSVLGIITGVFGVWGGFMSLIYEGAAVIGVSLFPGLNLIMSTPMALTAVQRGINRAQRNRANRVLSKSVDELFDLEDSDQSPYRLKHRNYKILKNALYQIAGAQ